MLVFVCAPMGVGVGVGVGPKLADAAPRHKTWGPSLPSYPWVHRCSMALLHSRVRAVYYAVPNPTYGGLGSRYRINVQPGLNHRCAADPRLDPIWANLCIALAKSPFGQNFVLLS